MKQIPILFSTPMVQAIIAGRKTQTRRIVPLVWRTKPPLIGISDIIYRINKRAERNLGEWDVMNIVGSTQKMIERLLPICPYGKPGDQLWVRETWLSWRWNNDVSPSEMAQRWGDRPARDYIGYPADNDIARSSSQGLINMDGRLRPSIHMPRWASRITLEITNVRVEHLNDISEEDAMAEGIASFGTGTHYLAGAPHKIKGTPTAWPTGKEAFASMWDNINGKRAPWASNPFVWVLEFKKI